MMTGEFKLSAGESIDWEAKPAPRCYTFRHWRHSIFGGIFLAICCYWFVLGIDISKEYELPWLVWLPIPFVLMGLYFSFGHLLQARLEWNNVRYLITTNRLVAMRGISKVGMEAIDLSAVTYFNLKMQGEELGTLRVHAGETQKVVLHCLEHPRRATVLLEQVIKNNLDEDTSEFAETPGKV